MERADRDYPKLRPVEAIPDPSGHRVILRDPTQLAQGLLVVPQEQLFLLALLDGRHRRLEIQAAFARRYGTLLLSHELDAFLAQLEQAGFLDGPGFEAYYARLADDYRRAPFRPLRDPDGFGAPAAELAGYLDRALQEYAAPGGPPDQRPAGIVTPHLDYPRGLPAYAAGYSRAVRGEPPRRIVVLGTNHFGRSRSVVATGKDFQTPWGVLPTDREFLERLQAELGGNLMPYELDHLREHSIELQVVWAHHLFGGETRIVPFLVPDPSGPNGTAPGDPDGVDTRAFAEALGRLVREDPVPTLLVASADLSHVGRFFGDAALLDEALLAATREADEAALAHVDRNDPEGYRRHMAATGNPTRVCSVGCLYALMTALGPDARAERLLYHQAVTREAENCVCCAAYAFYR